MDIGSIICIAFAYSENAINAIGVKKKNAYDKERWNFYSEEYIRLNNALNKTAKKIATEINGIAIPATVTNRASEICQVEDYYAIAISHRVIAEQSGVGWRGKNELIVNPVLSCAIRMASIITDIPIEKTSPILNSCGDCNACLDVCSFLRVKERLKNYREQCKRYISSLNLHSEVCGKCIKACYFDIVYRDHFSL
jgi:epoxyqueuosine reductase QueG